VFDDTPQARVPSVLSPPDVDDRTLRALIPPAFDANRAPWYTHSVRHGRIAQLGERFPYKEEVTGSSPVSPTFIVAWASP
jgi:hypothetical protein